MISPAPHLAASYHPIPTINTRHIDLISGPHTPDNPPPSSSPPHCPQHTCRHTRLFFDIWWLRRSCAHILGVCILYNKQKRNSDLKNSNTLILTEDDKGHEAWNPTAVTEVMVTGKSCLISSPSSEIVWPSSWRKKMKKGSELSNEGKTRSSYLLCQFQHTHIQILEWILFTWNVFRNNIHLSAAERFTCCTSNHSLQEICMLGKLPSGI